MLLCWEWNGNTAIFVNIYCALTFLQRFYKKKALPAMGFTLHLCRKHYEFRLWKVHFVQEWINTFSGLC